MSLLPFVLLFPMGCIFCVVFSWSLLPHPPSCSQLPVKLGGFSTGELHCSWRPRNISKNPHLPFFPPVATSPSMMFNHGTPICSPWPTTWDVQPCEVISFSAFFWGTSSTAMLFLSFAPCQVQAQFVPLAWPLLVTRQLFNHCFTSLLGLLISFDTGHGSFGITTFSLSFFSRIRFFHMKQQANPNLILHWPTAEPKYVQVAPPKHKSPPGLHNRQLFDTVS